MLVKSGMNFMAVILLAAALFLPVTALAGEKVIYSEGFESSDGNYTPVTPAGSTSPQWQWGTPTQAGPSGAHSGKKCWGTNLSGNMPIGAEGYLVSPAIKFRALSSGQVARVRFYAYIDVYAMHSRGAFSVSTDGRTWVTLAELFGDMGGGWKVYEFDISTYAGKNIFLRFRAYEGDRQAFPGLYIDDIAITVYDNPGGSKVTLTLEAREQADGSCPWVYTWDGTQFSKDNDIYSVARYPGGEYTDYYLLQKPLVSWNGSYHLEVREIDAEESWTDSVNLLAVDHDDGVSVAPDEKGNVFAYETESLAGPIYAVSSAGPDAGPAISGRDGCGFPLYGEEYIEVDFGMIDVSRGARLVLRVKGFEAGQGENKPYVGPPAIVVQTMDPSGNWVERGRLKPRFDWSECAFDLSPYLPDFAESSKVRLYSISHGTKYHEIDFVGLSTGAEPAKAVRNLSLVSAGQSGKNVLSTLRRPDGKYVHMRPGDKMSLGFEIGNQRLPSRDFIFVSKGYYIPSGNTYFIYTWDGSSWVLRDGSSYPDVFTSKDFDLSLFLPDPDGEYKVRIWQDYWYEPASINYVGIKGGTIQGTLKYALDIRDPAKPVHIEDLVSGSDDKSFDYTVGDYYKRVRNRWTAYKWSGFSTNKPPATKPVRVNGDTISWTYYDEEGEPQVACQVAVWTGPGGSGDIMWNPAAVTGGATSVQYAGKALTTGETYYARVKAKDATAWGQWSETSFTASGESQVTYRLIADVAEDKSIDLQDFHLIGLPGVHPDNPDPLAVFGGAGKPVYNPAELGIYQYNRATGGYKDYLEGISPVDPGRGYWVITSKDRTLKVNGTLVPSMQPYTVKLYPEWNVVGYPFLNSLAVEDVLVSGVAGGERVTYPLSDNPWIENQAWGFYKSYYPVVAGGASASSFEPWNAYWFYNFSSQTVNLLFVPSTITGPIKAESAQASPGGAFSGISFSLNEKSRSYQDKTLFLGINSGASSGPDSMDCLSPPPISSDVPRLFVDHGTWTVRPGKYAIDTRPLNGGSVKFVVTLKVPVRKVSTAYVLGWKLKNLPAGVKVTLTDSAGNRTINMKSRTTCNVTVPKHQTVRKLVVTVEKD